MPALYVDVIIPLAVKDTYTYRVPEHLEGRIQFGIRLEVPFGKKKLYSGLVVKMHHKKPSYPVKVVLSVIDDQPVVTAQQIKFWTWMSQYYLADLGEIMYAGMPAKLKLQSETIIRPGAGLDKEIFDLDNKEHMVAQAVSIQKEISIGQIQSILDIKTVYPIIKRLLDKRVIKVKEELQDTFQPKKVVIVTLADQYKDKAQQGKLFDLTSKSEHQTRAMLAIIQQQDEQKNIRQSDLIKQTGIPYSAISALEKKGLILRQEMTISRLVEIESDHRDIAKLSPAQRDIVTAIHEGDSSRPCLLHGVTGSGKTRIYIELILEALEAGRQVLYLLPEIALATQIVHRIKNVLGESLLVYHSRKNEFERVEVWRKILGSPKVILAARSGVFLPFSNLGLIIVDEEHDPSFKQEEPSPRYQARDCAIVLARIHGAKIILGSATPSIESYWNARSGKYNYLKLAERFGKMKMPEIILIDLKKKSLASHLSTDLVDELKRMKEEGFQSILFQNRRGFAPILLCSNCDWSCDCLNCDTSLTYHQYSSQMQCHLCGHREKPALKCPSCGNHELTLKGFGTEMIEEKVKILLPGLKVGRLDLDTARGSKNLNRIISQFEAGDIDVLIGTQMISKGLDFDRVGLVGILSADQILHFPDFRAAERAFQLITQVAGRSGRRYRKGIVLVQALHVHHPVLSFIANAEEISFYDSEIAQRQDFGFPPFSRLIMCTVRHVDNVKSDLGGKIIAHYMRDRLGTRVSGPITPGIARIRNRYLSVVMIKLEKKKELIVRCKQWIEKAVIFAKKQKGLSTLKIDINVDP